MGVGMKKFSFAWIKDKIDQELEIEGETDFEVTAAVGMEQATADTITFAVGRKNYKLLQQTEAKVAIVGKDAPSDLGCILIKVAQPEIAFIQVANAMAPVVKHPEVGIHNEAVVAAGAKIAAGVSIGAKAVIEDGVEIGESTIIYPGAYIGKGVVIGANTIIYPNVTIYYGCVIGSGVILHSGVVIGADGFGFKWDGREHLKIIHVGNVVIGDKVEVGANSTIDRGRFASTIIGNGCKIDNLVHIAHNCKIGDSSLFAAHVGVSGSVTIGKGVAAGGQVGFADHITVGDGCIFYAKSGVASDVGAGQTMVGQPAVEYRAKYKEYKNIRGIDKLRDRIQLLEAKLEELINETDNS